MFPPHCILQPSLWEALVGHLLECSDGHSWHPNFQGLSDLGPGEVGHQALGWGGFILLSQSI